MVYAEYLSIYVLRVVGLKDKQ